MKAGQKVKLTDVAALAGVSRAAAGKVLNGGSEQIRVGAETRKRILSAAGKLHYQPNLAAQLLRGKKSNTIAVFTGRGSSALQNEALKLIFSELQDHGFNCFTVPAADIQELKEKYCRILTRDIDGMISLFIDYDFDRSLFRLPQVHVGVNKDYLDVQEDVGSGSAFLCEHLLSHGRRRFVFLCDKVRANIRKYEAVEKTLHDFAGETELKILEFFHNDNILREIRAAAAGGFDAFFCVNDHIAARLCRLLQHWHVRVPEDAAVTGFDGMAFAEYVTPSLTTMRIDPHEIAHAAVELLLKRMKEPDLPASVKIPVHFHCGESCGCKVEPPVKFFFDKMLSVISEDLCNLQKGKD